MTPKCLPNDPPPSSSTSKDEEENEEVEIDNEEDQDYTTHTYNDGQQSENEEEKDQEENVNEDDNEEEEHQKENGNKDDDDKEEERKTSDDKSNRSDTRDESEADTEWIPSSLPTVSGFKPHSNLKKRARKRPKYRSLRINAINASTQPVETVLKENNSKKKNVGNVGDDENSKKVSLFQCLWSEEDEIALLTNMIDYRSKKGRDPDTDLGEIQKFMKNKLSVNASKINLDNKIKNLQNNYEHNAKTGKNGEDPVFRKPHNREVFKLSKKIWGNLDDDSRTVENKKEVIFDAQLKAEQDRFWSKFPFLKETMPLLTCPSGSESLMNDAKQVMPLIGSSKAEELENKWRRLHREEMKLYIEKTKLIQEQSKLIVDSLKTNVVYDLVI